MRNRLVIISILLSIVLLGSVVFIVAMQQEQEQMLPLSVQILSGEKTEQINCWKDREGAYYVFIPAYAELSEVIIQVNTSATVWLNGTMLYGGETCENFQLNVPYELNYELLFSSCKSTLTFMKSSDISTMYIETSSKSMDYVHSKKGNEETGGVSLYDCEGALNHENNQISLKGRGNATWVDSEKKSYSISLPEEADLLDMGSAQKWILLSNGLDESNLRNKIVYDLAAKVGLACSPGSRWVDLYLNGEYAGLYLLCERIEIHPERLNISYENSFLISSELEDRLIQQNYPYILTNTNLAMRIHYPENVTEEHRLILNATWRAIENAVLTKDGIDPETGKMWKELIDLDSLAWKYLIDEVFGNLDACLVSQYYYIDGNEVDEKVYAGIVWDYDLSMGNPYTWQLENPYSLFAGNAKFKPGLETRLFSALAEKEEFYNRVVDLFVSELMPEMEDLMKDGISEYAAEIEKSAAMNQIRWSFSENVNFHRDYIINYLNERTAFLQNMWVDGESYCKVTIDQGTGANYAYYMVRESTCLNELPEFESTPYQDPLGLWYYSDTNEPFDITKPITEDIEIYTTWKDNSDKKMGQVGKLLPLAVIAMMGLGLAMVELYRYRKRR